MSDVAAAVAARRAGARTMLIERQRLLGGVASAALRTSATNWGFTSDGRQVVKGLAEEVLDKLAERGRPVPSGAHARCANSHLTRSVSRTARGDGSRMRRWKH